MGNVAAPVPTPVNVTTSPVMSIVSSEEATNVSSFLVCEPFATV